MNSLKYIEKEIKKVTETKASVSYSFKKEKE